MISEGHLRPPRIDLQRTKQNPAKKCVFFESARRALVVIFGLVTKNRAERRHRELPAPTLRLFSGGHCFAGKRRSCRSHRRDAGSLTRKCWTMFAGFCRVLLFSAVFCQRPKMHGAVLDLEIWPKTSPEICLFPTSRFPGKNTSFQRF